MQEAILKQILENVQSGSLPIEEALQRMRSLPFEEVGEFARVDHHRAIRTGFPEVVFGQGKTPSQIIQIVRRLMAQNDRVLVTRVTPEMASEVLASVPELAYHETARLLILDHSDPEKRLPGVVVATGGTADIPVAEEAALTAELMGNQVERVYDVGVAGLHRLLNQLEKIQKAHVIVVAAGMEGALASVVGGLAAAPVIAVPTSIGYGASFGGLAALLTMLNSCATGVAVVNIDNGFGAGYLAGLINRQIYTGVQEKN